MPRHAVMSIGSMIWAIAFASLFIASLAAPADAEGLAGLACVGHLLWLVSLALQIKSGRAPVKPRGRLFTAVVLGVAGLCEIISLAVALRTGAHQQALLSGFGLSFALGGMALSARSAPGDGVFACQFLFHFLMTFPGLSLVIAMTLSGANGLGDYVAWSDGGQFTNQLVLISCMEVPCLVAALAFNLLYGAGLTADERDVPWTAFLASQAAFATMLYRCVS